MLRLGYAYLSSQPLSAIAEPHMERLVGIIHESCSLAALDGTEAVHIGGVLTRRIMAANLEVGTRLPAYASTMGRVTSHTITSPSHLGRAGPSSQSGLVHRRPGFRGRCTFERRVGPGQKWPRRRHLGASVHTGRVDLDTMREQFLPPVLEAASAITAELADHHAATFRRA